MKYSNEFKNKLKRHITDNFTLAGHTLTDNFNKSIEIKEEGDNIVIEALAYGLRLDSGISSDKIPYSGRSGRGGTSKYITGLKNYVQKRMGISDEREALSIAFAIATKHSRDGIKGSGFLQKAYKDMQDDIDNEVGNNLDKIIEKWL